MKAFSTALLVAIFLSAPLYAADHWHNGELERVYPLANGSFVITFKESHSSCNNGSNPRYHYVKSGENGVTPEGVQNMLTVALAAFMANKKLSIYFSDETSGCYVNRLLIINN